MILRRCVVLILAAVAACGTDTPTDTGATGSIRVTLAYRGSGEQRGATVALVGSDETPTVSGNAFRFSSLAPATYIVELSDIPSGCLVVGATQDTVVVTIGATADATFTIRCNGPDQLLVTSQTSSFALVNADGTDFHEILTNLSFATDLNWSPDGQRLAFLIFYAPSQQEDGLWTINVDGTGLTQVYPSNDSIPVRGVRWSPDGAHFAVTRLLELSTAFFAYHLHIVTADGGNEVQLPQTTDLSPSYGPAEWSPTGDRLAVGLRLRDSVNNVDGSKMQIFRSDGADEGTIDVQASVVRWSPAGDRIAYSQEGDIHTVRPDGTDDTPVRSGVTFDWSPDGTRLAIIADGGVRVVNADGSNDVLVFPASDAASPSSVAWSPSGNKLAVVTSNNLDLNNCCPAKVVVMNVDGSNPIVVTGETTGYSIAIWRP